MTMTISTRICPWKHPTYSLYIAPMNREMTFPSQTASLFVWNAAIHDPLGTSRPWELSHQFPIITSKSSNWCCSACMIVHKTTSNSFIVILESCYTRPSRHLMITTNQHLHLSLKLSFSLSRDNSECIRDHNESSTCIIYIQRCRNPRLIMHYLTWQLSTQLCTQSLNSFNWYCL